MFGKRWKQIVNLGSKSNRPKFLIVPKPSESSSSNSSDMPSNTHQRVFTQSETLVLGHGNILGRDDGTWEDVDYYFVRYREDKSLEYDYRDLSEVYGGLDRTSGPGLLSIAHDQLKFQNAGLGSVADKWAPKNRTGGGFEPTAPPV